MPNWCEGTLKVRGKRADIVRFLTNACHCSMPKHDDDGIAINKMTYIEGTYRGFINAQNIICAYLDSGIVYFRYQQAWDLRSEDFKNLSKTYKIDFKIFAYEHGCCFARDLEVVSGKIIKNDFIKYANYLWECPCPDYGG